MCRKTERAVSQRRLCRIFEEAFTIRKTQITEVAEERASENPSAAEIKNILEKEGARIEEKYQKALPLYLCV